SWLVLPQLDAVVVRLALLGWLVPVAVAFSARNFPLFIWSRLPSPRALQVGVFLLLAGLAIELPARGLVDLPPATVDLGKAMEGAALLWLTIAIGALGPKRTPPGRMADPTEAAVARLSRWPLMGAYAWLAVAGVLLLVPAITSLAGWLPPPEDAERHAIGAGFLLLLVVGMALRLLPGFAGIRHHTIHLGAARAAVAAAHVAALLRVAPLLISWAFPSSTPFASWWNLGVILVLSLSGAAGLAAVGCLAAALRVTLTGTMKGRP
ncbi:MAG: hypothetical protein ACRDJN_13370, partial [Chloroflexota bacterium]